MLTCLRVLMGVFLLRGLSLTSRAQDVVTSSPGLHYRWYAGVQAGFQAFSAASVYTVQESIIGPVYGYLGYQLTSHLAVQAGYMQRNHSESGSLSGTNATGQPYSYAKSDNYYNAAVPVLLRLRLARRPIHRLHLDALLGSTVLFHHYHLENNYTVANQPPVQEQLDLRAKNWYITGGLSLGFTIVPHLELTGEATNNWYLNARDDYYRRFQPGAGIGLRYHFNAPKAG